MKLATMNDGTVRDWLDAQTLVAMSGKNRIIVLIDGEEPKDKTIEKVAVLQAPDYDDTKLVNYGYYLENQSKFSSYLFLGTIDDHPDMKKESKKTVVKEAILNCTHGHIGGFNPNLKDVYEIRVPMNAKNIKCTYEIDE